MRYIILCLVTIFFNSFLVAQENGNAKAKKGVRHIFSFSISNFDKLKYQSIPTKSTNQIIEKLKAENQLTQFSEIQVHGADLEMDSSSIFSVLKKIESKITDNDELIIYISSHGVEAVGPAIRDSKSNIKEKAELLYIVTNEDKENWIPMVEIVKILSKPKFLKAKKLLIMNTCRAYDSEESTNASIGKKWKDYANTTEGFIEGEPEFKKFLNGDRTAKLNLAIMYACVSGMKAYFLEKEQYAFFSESLKNALSYETVPYSLQQIFDITRSLTIHEAKRKKIQRQEPIMIVYSEKKANSQNTKPGSKTFINGWFFGKPQNGDEKKELDLVKSGELSKEIADELKDKVGNGKLTDLAKIREIQVLLTEVKGSISQLLDTKIPMDEPGFIDESFTGPFGGQRVRRIPVPLHRYDIHNLVKIIELKLEIKVSKENYSSYSGIMTDLADTLIMEKQKINKEGIDEFPAPAVDILTAFAYKIDAVEYKRKLIVKAKADLDKLIKIYDSGKVFEFIKETNRLSSTLQDD